MRLCTIDLLKLFKSPTVCYPTRSHTQPKGLMQYQSKVENWEFVNEIKFDVETSCHDLLQKVPHPEEKPPRYCTRLYDTGIYQPGSIRILRALLHEVFLMVWISSRIRDLLNLHFST
jgi:hypothetical protein